MQVRINERGTMIITSETQLESYALKQWTNENIEDAKINAEKVIFYCPAADKEKE